MERKPPIVTSISNRLAVVYMYFDLAIVGYFLLLFSGLLDELLAAQILAVLIGVWLFGVLAGVIQVSAIPRARLVLLLGFYALIISLLNRFILSTEDEVTFLSSMQLVTVPFLFVLLATVGKLARLQVYMLSASGVILLLLIHSFFTGRAISLELLTILIYVGIWVFYGFSDKLYRSLGLGLLAVVSFVWYVEGFDVLNIPLLFSLFTIFTLKSSALAVLPLGGVIYYGWNNLDLGIATVRDQIDVITGHFSNVKATNQYLIGEQGGNKQLLSRLLSLGLIGQLLLGLSSVLLASSHVGSYYKSLMPVKKTLSLISVGLLIYVVLTAIFESSAVSDLLILFTVYVSALSVLVPIPSE